MSNCRTNFTGNQSFPSHIRDFVGENVIIFTESGGASGCGFEGILLSVNCDFVRLATNTGTAPSNPLSETICGDFDSFGGRDDDRDGGRDGCRDRDRDRHRCRCRRLGSICDIPINKIVAFCHNAV